MDCRFFLGLDEAPRDVTLRQIRSDIVSSRTRQNYTCITPSKEYLEDIGAFIRAKQDWASLSYHPNVHQLYFGRECLISSQNELASQKIWRLFAQYVEVVDPDILTLADTVSGFCIDTCDSVSALAQFEKRFLDAGVQLACAVTQAHSHGIIHMAVHAKNVLVSPRVNLASPRFSVDNSDGGGGGEGGNVPPRDEVDLASSIVARRMRTKNMFSSALSGLSEADLGLKPSKESFDIPLQLRLSNFLCSTPLLSSDEGKLFEVLELVDVCLVLLHLATSLSFEEFCKVGLDAQQNELSNSHGSVNSKRSFASFCGRLSISARREGDGGGTRRGGGSVRKSVLLNLGVSSMEDEERARLRAEKERERAEREQEGAHMEPDKFLQRELPHARIQLAGRFAQALQAAEDSRSRDLLREFEGQKKKGRKGKLVEWQRTLTGVSTSVDADRFQKRPDKDVVTTPSSLHLPLPHETSGLSHSPGTASSKEKHVELQDAGSSASEGSTNRHSESHLGRSVGDSSPTAHIRGILSAKPSENNEDASRSSRLLAHTKSLRFAERTDEGGPEGESLMIGSLSMDLEEEKRKAEAREKKNEDIARRERVNRVIRFRTFVMDWNQVEQFFFWAVEVMRDVAFDMSGRTLWKVPGCDDEGEEYQLTVRGKNEGWDDEDDEEDDLSSGEREDLTGIEKRIQTFLIMTARVILDATKRLIAVLESQPEKELRALGQRVNKATEIEAYLEFIENENESDRLKGKEEKMPDGEKEKMEMGKGCTAEWLLDGLFDSLQQAGAPAGHHILPHRLSSDERKFFASRGLLMRGLCLMEAQKCRTALRMFEVARSYDSSFIEAAVNAVLLRFSLEAREREGDLGELDGLLAEGCDELLEDFRTGGERTRGGETGTIAAPLRTVSKRGSVGSQNKMDDVSERRLWDPWACQAPLVSFGRLGLLKDLYGLPGPAAEAEGSRVLSLFGELQSLPVSTVRDAAAVAALLKGGWLIEAALIADRGLARVKGLAPARVLTPFEVAPSGRNSKSGLGLVHMADLPFVSFLLQAHAALVRLFSEVNIFAVLSPLCGLPTLYFTHSSRATASIPNGVAIPPGTNASQMPRLKKRLGASVTLQGHNETSEGSGAKSSFLFAKETLDVDASFASAVREASTGLRQFPLEHVHVHFCSPDYILLHGGAFSVACAHESKCGRAAPGHIKETTSLLLHVSKQRHDFWLLEMQPPSSCPIARLMVSLPSRRVLVVLYVNGDLQTFDLENKRTAFGLLRSQGLLGQEATQNDGVPSFHFLKPAKPLLLPRRLTDQIRDLIQGDNRVCLEAYNRRLRLRTKQKPRLFRARVSASPSRSRRETTNIRGEEIFQEDEDEEEGGFILNNLTVPHLEHVNCLDMAQTAELYASPNACVVFLFRDRWRAPQRFGTESSQIVEDELDYANSDPSTLTTLRVAQLRLKEGRVYGQHILTVKYEDTDTEMMAQKQKGKKTAPYGGNQGDNLAGAAGLNRDDTAAAKRASTVQQHTGGVIDGDPGGGAFDLRRVKRWTAFVGAHLLWSAKEVIVVTSSSLVWYPLDDAALKGSRSALERQDITASRVEKVPYGVVQSAVSSCKTAIFCLNLRGTVTVAHVSTGVPLFQTMLQLPARPSLSQNASRMRVAAQQKAADTQSGGFGAAGTQSRKSSLSPRARDRKRSHSAVSARARRSMSDRKSINSARSSAIGRYTHSEDSSSSSSAHSGSLSSDSSDSSADDRSVFRVTSLRPPKHSNGGSSAIRSIRQSMISTSSAGRKSIRNTLRSFGRRPTNLIDSQGGEGEMTNEKAGGELREAATLREAAAERHLWIAPGASPGTLAVGDGSTVRFYKMDASWADPDWVAEKMMLVAESHGQSAVSQLAELAVPLRSQKAETSTNEKGGEDKPGGGQKGKPRGEKGGEAGGGSDPLASSAAQSASFQPSRNRESRLLSSGEAVPLVPYTVAEIPAAFVEVAALMGGGGGTLTTFLVAFTSAGRFHLLPAAVALSSVWEANCPLSSTLAQGESELRLRFGFAAAAEEGENEEEDSSEGTSSSTADSQGSSSLSGFSVGDDDMIASLPSRGTLRTTLASVMPLSDGGRGSVNPASSVAQKWDRVTATQPGEEGTSSARRSTALAVKPAAVSAAVELGRKLSRDVQRMAAPVAVGLHHLGLLHRSFVPFFLSMLSSQDGTAEADRLKNVRRSTVRGGEDASPGGGKRKRFELSQLPQHVVLGFRTEFEASTGWCRNPSVSFAPPTGGGDLKEREGADPLSACLSDLCSLFLAAKAHAEPRYDLLSWRPARHVGRPGETGKYGSSGGMLPSLSVFRESVRKRETDGALLWKTAAEDPPGAEFLEVSESDGTRGWTNNQPSAASARSKTLWRKVQRYFNFDRAEFNQPNLPKDKKGKPGEARPVIEISVPAGNPSMSPLTVCREILRYLFALIEVDSSANASALWDLFSSCSLPASAVPARERWTLALNKWRDERRPTNGLLLNLRLLRGVMPSAAPSIPLQSLPRWNEIGGLLKAHSTVQISVRASHPVITSLWPKALRRPYFWPDLGEALNAVSPFQILTNGGKAMSAATGDRPPLHWMANLHQITLLQTLSPRVIEEKIAGFSFPELPTSPRMSHFYRGGVTGGRRLTKLENAKAKTRLERERQQIRDARRMLKDSTTVTSVAVSDSGRRLAVGFLGGRVDFYSDHNLAPIETESEINNTRSPAVAKSAQAVLTGDLQFGRFQKILSINAHGDELVPNNEARQSSGSTLSFFPNVLLDLSGSGRTAVTASRTVRVWDVEAGGRMEAEMKWPSPSSGGGGKENSNSLKVPAGAAPRQASPVVSSPDKFDLPRGDAAGGGSLHGKDDERAGRTEFKPQQQQQQQSLSLPALALCVTTEAHQICVCTREALNVWSGGTLIFSCAFGSSIRALVKLASLARTRQMSEKIESEIQSRQAEFQAFVATQGTGKSFRSPRNATAAAEKQPGAASGDKRRADGRGAGEDEAPIMEDQWDDWALASQSWHASHFSLSPSGNFGVLCLDSKRVFLFLQDSLMSSGEDQGGGGQSPTQVQSSSAAQEIIRSVEPSDWPASPRARRAAGRRMEGRTATAENPKNGGRGGTPQGGQNEIMSATAGPDSNAAHRLRMRGLTATLSQSNSMAQSFHQLSLPAGDSKARGRGGKRLLDYSTVTIATTKSTVFRSILALNPQAHKNGLINWVGVSSDFVALHTNSELLLWNTSRLQRMKHFSVSLNNPSPSPLSNHGFPLQPQLMSPLPSSFRSTETPSPLTSPPLGLPPRMASAPLHLRRPSSAASVFQAEQRKASITIRNQASADALTPSSPRKALRTFLQREAQTLPPRPRTASVSSSRRGSSRRASKVSSRKNSAAPSPSPGSGLISPMAAVLAARRLSNNLAFDTGSNGSSQRSSFNLPQQQRRGSKASYLFSPGLHADDGSVSSASSNRRASVSPNRRRMSLAGGRRRKSIFSKAAAVEGDGLADKLAGESALLIGSLPKAIQSVDYRVMSAFPDESFSLPFGHSSMVVPDVGTPGRPFCTAGGTAANTGSVMSGKRSELGSLRLSIDQHAITVVDRVARTVAVYALPPSLLKAGASVLVSQQKRKVREAEGADGTRRRSRTGATPTGAAAAASGTAGPSKILPGVGVREGGGGGGGQEAKDGQQKMKQGKGTLPVGWDRPEPPALKRVCFIAAPRVCDCVLLPGFGRLLLIEEVQTSSQAVERGCELVDPLSVPRENEKDTVGAFTRQQILANASPRGPPAGTYGDPQGRSLRAGGGRVHGASVTAVAHFLRVLLLQWNISASLHEAYRGLKDFLSGLTQIETQTVSLHRQSQRPGARDQADGSNGAGSPRNGPEGPEGGGDEKRDIEREKEKEALADKGMFTFGAGEAAYRMLKIALQQSLCNRDEDNDDENRLDWEEQERLVIFLRKAGKKALLRCPQGPTKRGPGRAHHAEEKGSTEGPIIMSPRLGPVRSLHVTVFSLGRRSQNDPTNSKKPNKMQGGKNAGTQFLKLARKSIKSLRTMPTQQLTEGLKKSSSKKPQSRKQNQEKTATLVKRPLRPYRSSLHSLLNNFFENFQLHRQKLLTNPQHLVKLLRPSAVRQSQNPEKILRRLRRTIEGRTESEPAPADVFHSKSAGARISRALSWVLELAAQGCQAPPIFDAPVVPPATTFIPSQTNPHTVIRFQGSCILPVSNRWLPSNLKRPRMAPMALPDAPAEDLESTPSLNSDSSATPQRNLQQQNKYALPWRMSNFLEEPCDRPCPFALSPSDTVVPSDRPERLTVPRSTLPHSPSLWALAGRTGGFFQTTRGTYPRKQKDETFEKRFLRTTAGAFWATEASGNLLKEGKDPSSTLPSLLLTKSEKSHTEVAGQSKVQKEGGSRVPSPAPRKVARALLHGARGPLGILEVLERSRCLRIGGTLKENPDFPDLRRMQEAHIVFPSSAKRERRHSKSVKLAAAPLTFLRPGMPSFDESEGDLSEWENENEENPNCQKDPKYNKSGHRNVRKVSEGWMPNATKGRALARQKRRREIEAKRQAASRKDHNRTSSLSSPRRNNELSKGFSAFTDAGRSRELGPENDEGDPLALLFPFSGSPTPVTLSMKHPLTSSLPNKAEAKGPNSSGSSQQNAPLLTAGALSLLNRTFDKKNSQDLPRRQSVSSYQGSERSLNSGKSKLSLTFNPGRAKTSMARQSDGAYSRRRGKLVAKRGPVWSPKSGRTPFQLHRQSPPWITGSRRALRVLLSQPDPRKTANRKGKDGEQTKRARQSLRSGQGEGLSVGRARSLSRLTAVRRSISDTQRESFFGQRPRMSIATGSSNNSRASLKPAAAAASGSATLELDSPSLPDATQKGSAPQGAASRARNLSLARPNLPSSQRPSFSQKLPLSSSSPTMDNDSPTPVQAKEKEGANPVPPLSLSFSGSLQFQRGISDKNSQGSAAPSGSSPSASGLRGARPLPVPLALSESGTLNNAVATSRGEAGLLQRFKSDGGARGGGNAMTGTFRQGGRGNLSNATARNQHSAANAATAARGGPSDVTRAKMMGLSVVPPRGPKCMRQTFHAVRLKHGETDNRSDPLNPPLMMSGRGGNRQEPLPSQTQSGQGVSSIRSLGAAEKKGVRMSVRIADLSIESPPKGKHQPIGRNVQPDQKTAGAPFTAETASAARYTFQVPPSGRHR